MTFLGMGFRYSSVFSIKITTKTDETVNGGNLKVSATLCTIIINSAYLSFWLLLLFVLCLERVQNVRTLRLDCDRHNFHH